MSTLQEHMQDWPLTLDRILEHAQRWHGAREVVTRSIEGPITRCSYADIHRRARQVSNALLDHGIRPGDRVATLAFNSSRHLEAWYGIMGIGAVCHTLNPRLFAEQLVYIVNHAGDRLLLADTVCLPVLHAILPRCPRVEQVILLTDEIHMPADFEALAYESWIGRHDADWQVGRFRRGFPGGSLLHLGHDRGAEGRTVLAPLELSAHAARRDAGHSRPLIPGYRARGRADVSRQCLGTCVRGACGRCPLRPSRHAPRRCIGV